MKERDFDVEAEIMRQAVENQPEQDPLEVEIRELVESGTYPADMQNRNLKFIMAYQNALKDKTREVIGCGAIDYLMRKENMSFQEAYDTVFERAQRILKAGNNLFKLNNAFAHLFN